MLTSTTLVQSGSRIICNPTSASTSLKQDFNESSGLSSPSGRVPNAKISGLESVSQRLASERISKRAAEVTTGIRRPGKSFNYKSAWRKWVSSFGER